MTSFNQDSFLNKGIWRSMEVQDWQNKQISKIQEQKKTIKMQKHRTH